MTLQEVLKSRIAYPKKSGIILLLFFAIRG